MCNDLGKCLPRVVFPKIKTEHLWWPGLYVCVCVCKCMCMYGYINFLCIWASEMDQTWTSQRKMMLETLFRAFLLWKARLVLWKLLLFFIHSLEILYFSYYCLDFIRCHTLDSLRACPFACGGNSLGFAGGKFTACHQRRDTSECCYGDTEFDGDQEPSGQDVNHFCHRCVVVMCPSS